MAFFVVVLFGVTASAQQPKTDTSKQVVPARSMQISQYMREAGLTYLEVLDKAFDQASQDYWAYRKAKREESDSYLIGDIPMGLDITDNLYGKELTRMEDHMEIDIKSEPDKKFLKLLEDTKYFAKFAYFEILRQAEPTLKDMPPVPNLVKLYPACFATAKVIVKNGIFEYGLCRLDPKAKAELEDSCR